jgi:hypothetical protein
MSEISSFLFGYDYTDKIKAFDDSIIQLDKKYVVYFQSREAKSSQRKHDTALNHYIVLTNAQGVTLQFNNDSDLRHDIKIEIQSAFKEIFK